jgi:hypothetical protein
LRYPTRRNIVDTGVGGIELEDENGHQQGDVLQTQFLLDHSLQFWSEQNEKTGSLAQKQSSVYFNMCFEICCETFVFRVRIKLKTPQN